MASRPINCLCIYLVVITSLWDSKPSDTAKGLSKEKHGCSFPAFLQESCKGLTKNCRHWSQGKRRPYDENSASYEHQESERRGEYTWTFNEGKVQIFGDLHPSVITFEFYCWKKIAPHVFIISSKNNETNENNLRAKYSCIKFSRRGRNVIELERTPWKENHTTLASCNASDLNTDENPLMLTSAQEMPDCPSEMRGGLQIMKVYNALSQQECLSDDDTGLGTLELDCMGKEGILIHFRERTNCSLNKRSYVAFHLALSCYSTPWKDGNFTYFIAKSRTVARNAFTPTDFLCARFQRVVNESGEEFTLQLYKQPICVRNASASSISLTMHLRRRKNAEETEIPSSEITRTDCSFPEKFQGIWKEISQHNGLQNVVINENTVYIPPYGEFHCKQQYIFQHQAPYQCSSLVTGKWPGTGRAKFFIGDYLLLSYFTNGCRPRLTRFGITDIIGSDALVYRLSQSQPILSAGHNEFLEYYYFNHVLRLFCSSWLPYTRDPYPIWGRNIDKIIMQSTSVAKTARCTLPPLSKGVYYFKSVNADQSECSGQTSRIQFACEKSFAFEVEYDPRCRKPDVSFTCLGLAWKIGEFFLVQDVNTKNISCMWFDEQSNQLFRLNSPQCSDIDWGQKRPGNDVNYDEKFAFRYYSKCPVISRAGKIDYPIVIKVRNASGDFNEASLLMIITCLAITINR